MTRILLTVPLLALTLLAACRDEQGPMQPGIYDAIGDDGSKVRMVFKTDGTFAEMADNKPDPVDQGTWQRRDGKLCFQSEQIAELFCFEEKPLGEDGFTLTANGQTAEFHLLAR